MLSAGRDSIGLRSVAVKCAEGWIQSGAVCDVAAALHGRRRMETGPGDEDANAVAALGHASAR